MSSVPPRTPTAAEFDSLAERFGFAFSDEEAAEYRALLAAEMKMFARLDALPDWRPRVKYPRTPGWRPTADENPYNAWYWRCEIAGAASGPLAGLRVGVKDSICVAGVPMANGTSILRGFVPDIDATVVTRLLDAGATVAGKTTTPDFTVAGGPHAAVYGPVLNPRRTTHSPGASSSGSGAAVAAGDVELALGGDQGGSIRYPASLCGIVGLKPTFGLVPYTGCMPIEITLDHVGPMTDTVRNAALMLDALAGPDGLDPRQHALPENLSHGYSGRLDAGVNGLRIAVLKEGFGHEASADLGQPASEPVVDRTVAAAVRALQDKGATVAEVSVPMHMDGVRICVALLVEGMAQLVKGRGTGSNWEGYYNVGLQQALFHGLKASANELPVNAKNLVMLGEHLDRTYGGYYYARAQNLRARLRAAYDAVLQTHDVIVMPATPTRALPLGPTECSIAEAVALRGLANLAQFNVTGHPAISVPYGEADGLPIGVQAVGRRFEDATVLQVAAAIEALNPARR